MALSYDELDNEAVWRAEYEPPPLARHNARLRARYSLTKSQCGSKGDNRHLKGRHRSYNWCTQSAYCTNPSYGTTAARDKRGPRDALRATDLGLSGPRLWDACRRVDDAVRAGRLKGLAEWYGTFDGVTVVGWSNGRPASSDRSHLTHGHFGYWNDSVEDEAFFDELFDVITGDDMAGWTEADIKAITHRMNATVDMADINPFGDNLKPEPNELARAIRRIESGTTKLVDLLAKAIESGGGNLDTAAVLQRIDERAAEDAARDAAAAARIAELEADVARLEAELAAVPDAVADELHQRTES